MSWLTNLLMIVQVITALAVIVLVLLQHGKGADMGAAFGGGASGSLFGATGSANFLSRSTGVLATLFFIVTLWLAMVGQRPAEAPASVMETAPAVPAPARPSDVPPAGSAAPAGATGAGASDAGQTTPKNGAASDIPK
jgi:preprotein translocase subunit SecG